MKQSTVLRTRGGCGALATHRKFQGRRHTRHSTQNGTLNTATSQFGRFEELLQRAFFPPFLAGNHMGGSSSKEARNIVHLSAPQNYCAIVLDSDLVMIEVTHPLVWDSSFSSIGVYADAISGTPLERLFGESNTKLLRDLLPVCGRNTLTLQLRATVESIGDVVVVCSRAGAGGTPVSSSSGPSCCSITNIECWLVPAHQAAGEKHLSRDNADHRRPAILQRCVTCCQTKVEGFEGTDLTEALTEACRSGRTILHHVVTTSCVRCNVAKVAVVRADRKEREDALAGDSFPARALVLSSRSSFVGAAFDSGPPTAAGAPKRHRPNQSARVILVCSADTAFGDRLLALCVQLGCTGVPFAGATALLRHVESGAPADLLVTDVVLPRVSGTELIKMLVAKKWGKPIVAFGGSPAFSQLALACGATTFLLRSSTDEAVKRTVLSLLG